jgi:hypothetical protein
MPLFQRRREQKEKADRIARGESIAFHRFDENSRTRVLYAIVDNAPSDLGDTWGGASPEQRFGSLIRAFLLREWGWITLTKEIDPVKDLAAFVGTQATEEQMLDVIEASFSAFDKVNASREFHRHDEDREANTFRQQVNRILDEHDLAYQIVEREIVPRESMTMHANIVAPTLSLLHGDARLTNVEKAFQAALRELKPGGDPSDAITDAGTALQEMLVILGAKGNALGPLLTSARSKGLLGPYDSKLAEGVENIGEWVSADRSSRGDAHLVRETGADDAWLAVHVVGALILRLEERL